MSSVKVKVKEGLYLIKSKFDWIILGKTETNKRIDHENTMFGMTHSSTQILPELQHFSNTDDSMLTPPNMNNFWKLEILDTTPQKEKEEDESAMHYFKRSMKKEDGRYYVAWSWKDHQKSTAERSD